MLKEFPEIKPQLDEAAAIAASTADDPEIEYRNAWFSKHDPGTAKGWFKADADVSEWREVTLPGRWADCGIPGFEGLVWARRSVELPAAWTGKTLVVRVGEISGNDTSWLNCTVIGRTNRVGVPRRYRLEAGIAKPGTIHSLSACQAGSTGSEAPKMALARHLKLPHARYVHRVNLGNCADLKML